MACNFVFGFLVFSFLCRLQVYLDLRATGPAKGLRVPGVPGVERGAWALRRINWILLNFDSDPHGHESCNKLLPPLPMHMPLHVQREVAHNCFSC